MSAPRLGPPLSSNTTTTRGRLDVLTVGAATGAATIILDLVLARGVTGVLATIGMLPVTAILLRALLREEGWHVRRRLRALLGVDAFLVLVVATMLAARTYVWVEQLSEGDASAYGQVARLYTLAFIVVASFSGLSAAMPSRLAQVLLRLIQRPALLLAGSFAAAIAVATVFLMLPPAVEDVAKLSFVDAFFMATSAVCVTGLTVHDPGLTYTTLGEIVILLAIQFGGIGIMTIAALSIMFARDTALATQLRYAQMIDVRTLSDLRTTVGSIVAATLAIEAAGALVLWWLLDGHTALDGASAAWMAVFHAVSAFCSAGVSLIEGGLARFAADPSVQGAIMALTLLGGIGFPVLRELVSRAIAWGAFVLDRRGSPRPLPLSLSTRVVLTVSAVLVAVGALLLGVLEWGASFRGLEPGHRALAAVFMSVNTRTSGFSSVELGAFSTTGLVVVCLLMFVGGSPGSTAGGIKTTTFAAILATLRAELSGGEPVLGRRALANEIVRRAVAVTALSVGIVLLGVLALTVTESHALERLLFEVVAAFSTAGLSTGLTPELSTPGKLIVAALMFIGRVGPLTIALAVGKSIGTVRYRLATESLPIG